MAGTNGGPFAVDFADGRRDRHNINVRLDAPQSFGVQQWPQIQEKTHDYSSFGLKPQIPTPKSTQPLARPRAAEAGRNPHNVSFGLDTVAGAKSFLAQTTWALGEVARARVLIEEAIARAVETAHAPTLASTNLYKALLETLRGDADGALRSATRVIELSREYGLAEYLAFGTVYFSRARARLGDRGTGSEELREGIATFMARGNKFWLPFFWGLLAEVEAEGQDVEQALTD
jgi:hypothetical protein